MFPTIYSDVTIVNSNEMAKSNTGPLFRVLCTTEDSKLEWGSYRLRCNDFKHYAERYWGEQVKVDAVSHTMATGHYNATIQTKTNKRPLAQVAAKSNGTISFGEG